MSETPYHAEVRVLGDVVRHFARLSPDKICMQFLEHETSYAELDRRSNQVANALVAAGIGPGGRVAVLARNTDRFFELLYGAVKANVVLVPVNFRLAPPEVAYVVDDARAEILFVTEEFEELVAGIEGTLATVRQVIRLGRSAPAGPGARWPEYARWRDAQPAADPQPPVSPEDTALQIYSSGTTGHPKGVELSHRNLTALIGCALEEWDEWSGDDVIQVVMPLFHVAGCEWAMLAFHLGARIVLHPDVDPPQILRALAAHGVTKTLYVPAVILLLLQTAGVRETDFSRLETIYYGASPIPLPVLREAVEVFRCKFVQLYGLTETTGGVTRLEPEAHDGGERMRSCGRPIGIAEVRVVDATGAACPPGTVGEIVVAGPAIMKGYWNRPEETAKAIRGRWLHTGDAGYFDEAGYLYIHDRIKDMIVSGGENIYPAEIESALAGHPAVADVAVIGVPDERWGEAVKAFVVAAPGAQPSPAALDAYARERLAGYKVPRSYELVFELPRNPSGKILKRVLRERFWAGRDRQVS